MRCNSFLSAALLTLSLAISGNVFGQAGQQIPARGVKAGKIGVLVQMTGLSGDFGVGIQNAVEIAKQDMKDTGIINLDVFYEDHQTQPQLALVGFEKLVDQRGVTAVLANVSSVVLALGPVAAERKVLIYNFAAVSPKLRTLKPWVVTGIPTSDVDGRELALYIFKDLGLKTVGVIHVNDQYGISSAEIFEQEYKAAGGKVVASEGHDIGATDMRTELLKVKSAKPEALVVISNYIENAHAVAQAREIGLAAKIFSNNTMISAENVKVAGAALNGVRGVTYRFDPEGSPAARAFVAKFKQRAGREPVMQDVLAYDGARLIGEAMSKVGNDAKAIRDYIVGVKDWAGLIGKINFDADGLIKLDLQIFEYVDGKPVYSQRGGVR